MFNLINDEMSNIIVNEASAQKKRILFNLFNVLFVVFLDENGTFLE